MICDLDGCGTAARLFPRGHRCAEHEPTPRPPAVDPALTLDGLRAAAGLPLNVVPGTAASFAAVDAKAIASGKRRASPAAQAEARRVVDDLKRKRQDLGGRR